MIRALAVYASLLVLAGCSGGGKRADSKPSDAARPILVPEAPRVMDAGVGTPPGAAPPYRLAARTGDGGVAKAGRIELTVTWPAAPPRILESRGRNACGGVRAPTLSQHHMGGVRNTFVWLQNVTRGRAPAEPALVEVAVHDCTLSPSAAVLARLGSMLEIVNDDERRHGVTLEHLGDGTGAPRPIAAFSLPLVGLRYSVPLTQPGIIRVRLEGVPSALAHVLVPAHPYYAVTGRRGTATLHQVPAGSYEVVAWHPPVTAGKGPRLARARAKVAPGAAAAVSISIAP